uniref:tRNA carboxymethyluridine synthase n=1 Tax=viral metagenome TaxID=1070528 RepID=A0A6C0HTI4_9ZZZZ
MTEMNIEDILNPETPNEENDDIIPFVEDLINSLKNNKNPTTKEIQESYVKIKNIYKIQPSKSEIRNTYENHFKHIQIPNSLKRWMIKKIMRSESGVLVVTIVTKPGANVKFSCPHKCSYCPTETDLSGNPTQPKSYISTEPAMLRALQYDFDIRGQIQNRLEAYLSMGNINGKTKYKKKIEVIVSGGTWDVLPIEYREQVIKEIYWTFNTFEYKIPRGPKSIEEEIIENEKSTYGVIGLTIETRPDYIKKETIRQYLDWGITRVQIGVQHFDDEILKIIKRGCSLEHTKAAIRLLKMVGLKVVVHLMPDLPGSSKEKDIWMFQEAIQNPDLQFDDVKIYPCAVIKSASEDRLVKSDISKWYDEGKYKPYSENNIQDLIDVCTYYKENINPWVRIERLIRDIPAHSIETGYKKMSNLRQIIQTIFKKENKKCHCIRCMEIKDQVHLAKNAKLVVYKYPASQGIEYHISIEAETKYWTWKYIWFLFKQQLFRLFNKKIWYGGDRKNRIGVFGFLRLRIDPTPGGGFVKEIEGAALIRELHVYGQSIDVGDNNEKSSQHKGYGQWMVKTAEEITKQNGLKKVAIIAGVGAREYYINKCGYLKEGTYTIKNII